MGDIGPIPNHGKGAVIRTVIQTDVGIVSVNVGNQSPRKEVGIQMVRALIRLIGEQYSQYSTP